MVLGFSTGSLAKGDFSKALHMLDSYPNLAAIELSALRENELPILVLALPTLNLTRYNHISLHAPGKLGFYKEEDIIKLLLEVVAREIHVIVHPDIITDFSKWLQLGSFLCIENMDKRKPVGRTTEDLHRLFTLLPEASFCLDLAHVKQVDPSMIECEKMLQAFSKRLIQFHISDVTSDSNHVPINIEAIHAFRKIEKLIPPSIPFIIESPIDEFYIERELKYINSVFNHNNHISLGHSFVNDKHSFHYR